jgi:hypothetical protein
MTPSARARSFSVELLLYYQLSAVFSKQCACMMAYLYILQTRLSAALSTEITIRWSTSLRVSGKAIKIVRIKIANKVDVLLARSLNDYLFLV